MPSQIRVVFCHSGACWQVRARPPCACGSRSGAARAWGPGKGEAAVGRSRSGSGCGVGRLGSGPAGRRAVSPGQSAPRHVRSAGGGNAGRGVAGPRRRRLPGRGCSGLGCAGLLGSGRRLGAGRGRRRRRRGPTDGKGRGSCQRVAGPLRWRNLLFLPRLAGALLSLSLSLTLSLPGWKFPLTSREDRRTHARKARGREVGSPPGVGKARTPVGPRDPGPAPPAGSASAP